MDGMNARERSFMVGGRRLAALQFGACNDDRGLVVALHGWLDNAASFHRLGPVLSEKRPLLALDFAGHGLSDWRPDGEWYAIWDYVRDVVRVLDQLGTAPIHLLGHSLGAAVASLVASVVPERVHSLVMLDGLGPLTFEAEESVARFRSALAWEREPRPEAVAYEERERMAQARARGRFPIPLESARVLVERAAMKVEDGWLWRHDPRLLAPSVVRMTESHVSSFFQAVEAPTLVCLAEQGIATESGRERVKQLPNATVVSIPGGHHPHLEVENLPAVVHCIERFYSGLAI
ncbi:MAG: alpha/beta hydrolase [Oceanospirillaceae bacterium]|jgi:pimeloyl-ACP methyl ester carboxylesterase|nr:alpha/beta hydrolase [Oceanospirillaceae bacterium]